MVVSLPRGRSLSRAWRFALIGGLVSLPLSAGINRLPESEASLGGGVMIFGAFIAGCIAAIRSTDPDAAGLRAGFLGGALAVLTFGMGVVGTVVSGTTTVWPLPRVVFWTFAIGLVLCVAPVFGLAFGRFGGWITNAVVSRWTTGANPS